MDKILDSHLHRNKLQFLVKWKGYTDENNSWEPQENCSNAHDAIVQFYVNYPNAPRQIARMQFENLEFRPYMNYMEYKGHILSHLEVET